MCSNAHLNHHGYTYVFKQGRMVTEAHRGFPHKYPQDSSGDGCRDGQSPPLSCCGSQARHVPQALQVGLSGDPGIGCLRSWWSWTRATGASGYAAA